MKEFSCSSCGGKVSKQEGKGQLFAFGSYGKVQLSQSLKIMQCVKCKEIYETGDDLALAEALSASLTDNVAQILEVIKEKHGIRKVELAFVTGIKPETLSRLKNSASGKKISSEKFLILKMIAAQGKKFITQMLENEAWSQISLESEETKKPLRRLVAKTSAGRVLNVSHALPRSAKESRAEPALMMKNRAK